MRRRTFIGACLLMYMKMEEKGMEVPSHAISLVVNGLCKDGKPFEGMAILEKMVGRGGKANVAVYTALMDSFAKGGNEEQAMVVFDRMRSEGFEPVEVAYGAVVNCLCKAGKLERAKEWFEYFKEKGVGVNVVVYTLMGLEKPGWLMKRRSLTR
ncbi:uncharacterized protein A4U43_C06F13190 [Asparagus officinalis]|uniref:Pentacotripeptide-repeat region of PRORP domain-containing protein n=1 Tax=Asparagus officinalis TaxID=4686 RepID=A0A5P1ELL8_ASPOF|nr:uncharacterized protein A4U43_C06F13190 [Asparagus officinalis]